MANFFIIDHSLRQSGGHHLDYVSCVAKVSNDLGFATTIGTNRAFSSASPAVFADLKRLGDIQCDFRDDTYQRDSYLAGLQHLTRSNSCETLLNDLDSGRFKRIWNACKQRSHRRRRQRFIRNFASDCERFFRASHLTEDDHAFVTTVSELELMGLAVFLSEQPRFAQMSWHLQFHFPIFGGRTPEYDRQGYIAEAVKSCFLTAMAKLSDHSVRFYATSTTLVDQYNRLGVGEFEELPYPVSPEFSVQQNAQEFEQSTALLQKEWATSNVSRLLGESLPEHRNSVLPNSDEGFPGSRTPQVFRFVEPVADSLNPPLGELESSAESGFRKPLRFTCPGELRREKKQVEYLQPLVDQIWESHLATGNVQIVVQRPAPKWPKKKSKIELELPRADGELLHPVIEYAAHPLAKSDYINLIKSSDCGLLFYDSRVYYSRRAGVLGELLSAGKPVIVPAGSWLADQIEEPIFQHVDQLIRSSRHGRTLGLSEFNWGSRNVPMLGGVLSFDKKRHPFRFSIDRDKSIGENAMAIQFDWHWPASPGVFCRIEVTQKDSNGDVIDVCSRVVGHRRSCKRVNSLFRMKSETETVDFSLTNAFDESTASVRNAEIHTLSFANEEEARHGFAIGQVGIIASDLDDLSGSIDEMVKYFDHYRDSAMRFADTWHAQHNPEKTVESLVSASKLASRAA